jgi:hypothetical protein
MKFPKFMIMNATDDLLGGGGGAPPAAPANPATPPAAPAAPAAKPTDPNDTTWKDGLPDDLKNDPTIKNLKDVPAALRMLLNAQKLIGKDKLVIPEPSATDEQWGEVMKKLGLPETVDKYDFKAPEGATPEFLKEFKEFAHKNAILPRQAEKFMGWFKERTEKALQEAETQDQHAFNSAVDGLKREWGTAYDRKIAEASGMFKTFTTEEERKELRELGFSNHPTVIKLMAKTAEAFGPGKFIQPGGNGQMGITPEEADKKITEVYSKYPNHPYFDKNNAGHAAARADMAQWNQAKLAGKKR